MKNIFRFLMAVAVLFTASCAKEDISSSIGGGEVEVTFTANLPELGTRANIYGNGANADILYYNVFDATTNEPLPQISGAVPGSKAFTVNIPMLKGMTYDIVFWAQKHTSDYYKLEGKELTVKYENDKKFANDNDRDAFYAYVAGFDPTKAKSNDTQISLYRPFAQLNAAVVDSDIDAVGQNEVNLTTSTVKVTTYTKFNLATGDVDKASETEVTFDEADMPYEAGETLKDGYKYLSMNYLLVPKAGMVSKVTFTFNNDKNIDFGTSYDNVPLKQNYRTNILGALLTKPTEFNVTIEKDFFKPAENIVPVATTKELQEALDNAVANTEIRLEPGVNYGTVLIRPVAGAANTITDCDYLVYRNEMLRKVENLTIVGAEGAKVEAFKVVAGHIEGSTGYVVDIKNLVIDGVEFNDTYTNAPHSYAAPIFFDLTYTNVDGLTVQNCELISKKKNNDKMNFVYIYGSGNPDNSTFETASKNIKIINNTVDGIARLCELRQTENVTITGNTIKNTALHGILLPVDNGTYSGNVTITENKAYNIGDRFVRMAGAGDAIVEITNNNIYNYGGEDADFIKVTDGNEDNFTIENNNLVTEVASWDEFTAVTDNSYVLLIENISTDKSYTLTKNLTIDLNGKTLEISGATNRLNLGNKNQASAPKPNVTIKNGNLNCKVYAQTGNTTLSDIKFGGSIAYTSDAQGVITVGSANLLAKRCDMANVKANAAETRPRALSTEGNSNGYLRLIDCNFPSSSDGTGAFVKTKLLRSYINPLSGNAELELTNCKFGVACNIDLASSYIWSNMNLTGCSGGFTFTISRSTDSVTEEETSIMKAIKKNNSGTIKAYYNGTLVTY